MTLHQSSSDVYYLCLNQKTYCPTPKSFNVDFKREKEQWSVERKRDEHGMKKERKDKWKTNIWNLFKRSPLKRQWHFKRPDFLRGIDSSSIRVGRSMITHINNFWTQALCFISALHAQLLDKCVFRPCCFLAHFPIVTDVNVNACWL